MEKHTGPGKKEHPPVSSLAVAACALAVMVGGAAALAGFGSQWGWWHFRTGFSILKWAAYGGLALFIFSLFSILITRRWSAQTLSLLLIGAMIGLLTFAVPWKYRTAMLQSPAIHDITTDTQNPPQFKAVLPLRINAENPPEYAGPETAALQQREYPDIAPKFLAIAPAEAFKRALAIAHAMQWKVVAQDPKEGRIEAVDTTFWFGFKDDIVIRIVPTNSGSRIDLRSQSRMGRNDLGRNAARIRAYMHKLQ